MAEGRLATLGEGAVGAGLVLVVAPAVALYYGLEKISDHPAVGLPVLAIFGIMILFGSMSLTATLFARLGLSDNREPLALPVGSIRATIALSLIVLFAIIAIMLFQSLAKPYSIPGLSEDDKKLLLSQPTNRVLAVLPSTCSGQAAGGAAAPVAAAKACYEVHLVQSPGQEAVDVAKQLLILIGTLMTSVTSFYFGARGSTPEKTVPPAPPEQGQQGQQGHGDPAASQHAAGPGTPAHDHGSGEDGCDVPVGQVTADEDLPAAKGGVEK